MDYRADCIIFLCKKFQYISKVSTDCIYNHPEYYNNSGNPTDKATGRKGILCNKFLLFITVPGLACVCSLDQLLSHSSHYRSLYSYGIEINCYDPGPSQKRIL